MKLIPFLELTLARVDTWHLLATVWRTETQRRTFLWTGIWRPQTIASTGFCLTDASTYQTTPNLTNQFRLSRSCSARREPLARGELTPTSTCLLSLSMMSLTPTLVASASSGSCRLARTLVPVTTWLLADSRFMEGWLRIRLLGNSELQF